jgi:nucleolar protein 53
LFVIDTIPSNNNKRKLIQSSSKKVNKKHFISENDQRKIDKLLEHHSPEALQTIAKSVSSNKDLIKQRRASKRTIGASKATFDLWDDSTETTTITNNVPKLSGVKACAGTCPIEFTPAPAKHTETSVSLSVIPPSRKLSKFKERTNANKPTQVRVDVAQPGQSYNPDPEQHQDVIGEALAIELKRNEALEYKNTPLSTGLKEETMRIMITTSDDEDDDSSSNSSNSDDEEDGTTKVSSSVKRKEKLTRAERNKRKRVKAEQVALQERKKAKKLLSSVNDAKKTVKDLRKEEEVRTVKRNEIKALKEEERNKPVGVNVIQQLSKIDPLNVPSLPVALTEELQSGRGDGKGGGSLRTVRPKGSLLTDRVESLISRKMANRKVMQKKKVVEGKRRKMKSGKDREYLLA